MSCFTNPVRIAACLARRRVQRLFNAVIEGQNLVIISGDEYMNIHQLVNTLSTAGRNNVINEEVEQ